MTDFNPSFARQPTVRRAAGAMQGYRRYQRPSSGNAETMDKWPVWARLLIIVGLSASLWALIILGVMAIF